MEATRSEYSAGAAAAQAEEVGVRCGKAAAIHPESAARYLLSLFAQDVSALNAGCATIVLTFRFWAYGEFSEVPH